MRTQKILRDGKSFTIQYSSDELVSVIRDDDNVYADISDAIPDEISTNEFHYTVYFDESMFSLTCTTDKEGNIETDSFYDVEIIGLPDDWDEDELDNMYC